MPYLLEVFCSLLTIICFIEFYHLLAALSYAQS